MAEVTKDGRNRIVWPKSQIVNSEGEIIDFLSITSGEKTSSGVFVLDADGNVTDISSLFDLLISSNSRSGEDMYDNIEDFTATPTVATKDIVLSGLSFPLAAINVVAGRLIRHTTAGVKVNENYTGLTVSGSTITFQGIDDFVASDTVFLEIKGPDKSRDINQDLDKVSVENQVWDHYTDVETLVDTAQELDATPTDAGAETDMRTYNQMGIWGTIDIGTSTNFTLRVLNKHTSAGSEEYREVSLDIGNPSATLTRVDYNDYIVLPDADGLFFLSINVANVIPYVQLQVFDAADGDGQLDKMYITKGYSPSL